ncbi:uridine kinase [Arthrobacter agilis]|uniref:uridine kinase n=1 Tax=Arthrobacter agilis TaxID=37921 RepID=UPI000F7F1151|nr:uridine kinase [Arthrobacter agilis]TPV21363.1 uridine kinase [Arthrobacter agilis]
MRDLVDSILGVVGTEGRIIAIDGVDGSGKTFFAANLAAEIHHRPVITIHADNFLNPSSVRHARGRHSPIGFWRDTYDYSALHKYVLTPLGPDGDGRYSPASYDPATDQPTVAAFLQAPPDALVLVEGMFLHRDELVTSWDASVYLDVPFAVTAARMAARNGTSRDPEHPTMRRYVHGQRLYFEAARPWERATFVIDNRDFTVPDVVRSVTPPTGPGDPLPGATGVQLSSSEHSG